MDEEIIVLKEKMENREDWQEANAAFSSGELYGHQVVLVKSGIGKVNAALAATLLISKYQVEAVINTGSAGAIDESLKIGDVVVSTALAYHSADATAFGYVYGQIPQMPARYTADDRLLDVTAEAITEVGLSPVKGLIVTSDSFIADSKRVKEIKFHFPDALVSEMEGAAVAQTCYQFQIPFVIVRAVSDTADNEANVSFDTFIIKAGKNSAMMVCHILEKLK
ncbi:methylthioadenosine nucleosidase /adenosylhomocysteine nucleosidase [Pisciglobus halotolerans]|uniref:adenosylhomocysteine nucleosidase n=2 Tax=Pisciglobus halotolerans TaxID=745365 RepID=A0A1I3BVQ2_9LACT|nr:methylthioadenosine nucleosidase /adenosylhomocysteine nucleosidase [Pisciglobus halotolerans]